MLRKLTYEELEQRIEELEKEVVELKQAENKREPDDSKQKESSILLEAVFNVIPDVIGIQDSIHEVIRYNEAGYRFLNMSHEEVKGKKCFELIGRTKPCEICATTEVYRTKAPARVEKYVEELGVWFDVRAYPILDEAGSITQVIEHLRDISEKKQKEKELQDSHDLLEERVEQRNAELKETNEALQSELIDRRRTEGVLRKERDFIESLFNTAQIIILVLDVEGRIVRFNPYMENLSGYRLEEVKGKDWFTTFLPEQDYDHIRALFRKAMSDTQTRGNINPIIGKDGREIFTEWHDKTLKDADGNVIGILSIGQDITERKQAEEALRKSVKRLRESQNIARLGQWELDLVANKLSWSDGIYRLFELNPDEFDASYESFLDAVHPDDREFVDKSYTDSLINKTPYKIVHRLLLKDGTVKYVNEICHTEFDKDGTPLRSIGTVQDITDLRLVEEALKESEEKYRTMMESMKEPVYICSPDYRIEYMNPAMIKRTGRDATGERCFKALHDLDEKCSWCLHHKTQTGDHFETDIVSPKDNRSYLVSNSPIFLKGGSISKMTIFRDTTDLKKMEAQLQQAQKMESIGTLAGGIAHDFNNILSPIMIHSEMAMMELPPDSPVQNSLKQIFQAGERASGLTKQILTFSRMRQKERSHLKVGLIVKECIKMLRASLPTTIEINQNLESISDTVLCDITEINQVLMNLCTNAAHAMRDKGGELTINLTEEHLDPETAGKFSDLNPGSYLKLTVSDTGHGIDNETMKNIFVPYYTTKELGEGTGMGLAVVHGIVRSYGGDITVESEPGKGTVFHVLLPTIESEASPPIEPSVNLPKGTERVLFVDDEKIAVDAVQPMLERLGYKVTGRTSSIEALEVFRHKTNAFDLVITDMTMPNMTGDALAKELMSIRSDIPIILCTGFSEKIDERRAKEMGISAFVMKPIVMRDMANTIREVLDPALSKRK